MIGIGLSGVIAQGFTASVTGIPCEPLPRPALVVPQLADLPLGVHRGEARVD